MVYFVSGHLSLTSAEFTKHYYPQLDQALAANASFVIGDARGADTRAQQYLHGKTNAVTIYHMFESPRNNAGFPTVGGFTSDSARDRAMTAASDADIAWVRPGREQSGTQRNLDRRNK